MAIVRLPANLVAHCDAIADAFTNQARKVDSRTWTQMQSDASIHDYMAHKLKEGLAFWRSPGQAAWAWHATGSPRKGFIFTDGTSQTTSEIVCKPLNMLSSRSELTKTISTPLFFKFLVYASANFGVNPLQGGHQCAEK